MSGNKHLQQKSFQDNIQSQRSCHITVFVLGYIFILQFHRVLFPMDAIKMVCNIKVICCFLCWSGTGTQVMPSAGLHWYYSLSIQMTQGICSVVDRPHVDSWRVLAMAVQVRFSGLKQVGYTFSFRFSFMGQYGSLQAPTAVPSRGRIR